MYQKNVSIDDDTLLRYFEDIKGNELITQSEEIELAKKIKNGDRIAMDKLINANLKFVISIAKEYQNQGTPLSDLISDGNEGLIKAVLKFDHTRGFRLISYAVWWIRQSIIYGLNSNARLVRLPTNVINDLVAINKEIKKFEGLNNRQPNDDEIDNTKYSDLLYNQKSVSLSTPIDVNGDETFIMEISDSSDNIDDDECDKLIKIEIDNMLNNLSKRERDIIILYYGLDNNSDPMTLDVIGKKYNLTKERVRQIKQRTIRKLRYNVNNLHLIMNIKR